jgi:hypothetical protein
MAAPQADEVVPNISATTARRAGIGERGECGCRALGVELNPDVPLAGRIAN